MDVNRRVGFKISARSAGRRRGMSLKEMLIVVSILGIIIAVGVPLLSIVVGTTKETVAKRNAQSFSSVSSDLATIGVAHVLPESLGGVEATARLLRQGIIVPDGAFQGQRFIVIGPSDEDIATASIFLSIIAQFQELSLKFHNGG